MKWVPGIFGGLLMLWSSSRAATEPAASRAQQARVPVLVELFTSEGCSSCPPADALLEQLDRMQPVAGAEAIVLSEHVDYWNRIGWKDPFSSSFYSDRQNAYASRFGLSSVYTPQMVVDGATEFTGSEPDRARAEIGKAGRALKLAVRLSSVRIEQTNSLRASIEVEDSSGSVKPQKAGVYVVLALDHAESQVLRGENAGRKLSHAGVARKLEKVGEFRAGERFSMRVEFKIDSGVRPEDLRLIAFVQENGMGRVLGASEQAVGGR
jgi:hypothetical protein